MLLRGALALQRCAVRGDRIGGQDVLVWRNEPGRVFLRIPIRVPG